MLLAKKDRGKPTEAQRQIVLAPFGADKAKEFLDGVETLPMENDEEAMDVEGIFQKYIYTILYKLYIINIYYIIYDICYVRMGILK